jgi:predicted RNase H-like nuclease
MLLTKKTGNIFYVPMRTKIYQNFLTKLYKTAQLLKIKHIDGQDFQIMHYISYASHEKNTIPRKYQFQFSS